jgi:hypothetical protein
MPVYGHAEKPHQGARKIVIRPAILTPEAGGSACKIGPYRLGCCAACFVTKQVVGMLIVKTIARLRREHFIKGKTIREIA